MTTSISGLGASEVDELSRLARTVWLAHYPPIIGLAQTEYMLHQRYDPAVIHAELESGTIWWDVLRVDGIMQAFASSFWSPSPRAVKLDKLYVHPARQRQGLARLLIDHVSERTRRLGGERVFLAVNKHNLTAIAAYRKHGFDIVDSIVKEIGEGFVMDDYVMQRAVKSEGVKGQERFLAPHAGSGSG